MVVGRTTALKSELVFERRALQLLSLYQFFHPCCRLLFLSDPCARRLGSRRFITLRALFGASSRPDGRLAGNSRDRRLSHINGPAWCGNKAPILSVAAVFQVHCEPPADHVVSNTAVREGRALHAICGHCTAAAGHAVISRLTAGQTWGCDQPQAVDGARD